MSAVWPSSVNHSLDVCLSCHIHMLFIAHTASDIIEESKERKIDREARERERKNIEMYREKKIGRDRTI